MEKDKIYEAELILGKQTDTQDISGQVLKATDVETMLNKGELTDEKILQVIESFVGDYDQIPPMYSALKVNGKKLYELAREGIEIERKARPVKILAIENVRIEFPRVYMTVSCSKGTYIRTLCHDIGDKLMCGACMEELKRTKVSSFTLENSLTLDEISSLAESAEAVNKQLITVEEIFVKYTSICTIEKFDKMLYNGNSVALSMLDIDEKLVLEENMRFRMYDSVGTFIGIFYYNKKEKLIKCDKMFYAAK